MELFANLSWMLVVVALIALRPRHDHKPVCRRTILAFVALACVAVLLFPVISITDDLCVNQQAVDDFSFRKARNISPGLAHSSLAALPASEAVVNAPAYVGTVTLAERPTATSALLDPAVSPRSPPFSV